MHTGHGVCGSVCVGVMQLDKFYVELQQAQQNALDESIDT